MQTQQEQNRYSVTAGTTPDQACRPAAEYAAVFPTTLALARWMRGGDVPHVFASARTASLRAAWYAQAQRQFQSWLEDGGFHAE